MNHELNQDERTILRVANLLALYEYCEKSDNKQSKLKKQLRENNPNGSK